MVWEYFPMPEAIVLDSLYLTDSGLETDAIFNHGLNLPCFSAVTLLKDEAGRAHVDAYFRRHIDVARQAGTGFVLESVTWRASPDWAPPLGLLQGALDALNRDAVAMIKSLRAELASTSLPMLVSGCIGPRGDGYDPGRMMTAEAAEAYHAHQAEVLAEAGVDLITALTINNLPEAIGVVRAAARTGKPMVLSFTTETDGRLPTGETLGEAIMAVDSGTSGYPAWFMVNCAHPSHFAGVLEGEWTQRLGGLRANASQCSHAELEVMETLDSGDPQDLGQRYAEILDRHPQIRVIGGCCGTDLRHIKAMAEACAG